jgi:predicted transcriptional regulator of viral defense system
MLVSAARLRQLAPREEIDYLFLQGALAPEYSQVRDKISQLIASGALIRVKKGLYVFGPEVARGPYSLETLANLIYGPSYISLEWALAHHGLIPERVAEVTSVTSKRDKAFNTPVGRFTYRYLHPSKYPVGLTRCEIDPAHPVLVATPEKALADRLALVDKRLRLESSRDVNDYLIAQLRIDFAGVRRLDARRLSEIAAVYRNANVTRLVTFVKELDG